ncbi:hypothetical protein HMPREF2806_05790 [Corynebacterium sp. HMSC076G08]|uniref:hypothetical protein n=1 Tax=Corynebacterium sp. HMSC076G08 TaxID=1739310 RepID=UPI0008A4DFAE|nr:hypothetical protein [Corynebacterium sp. HMSC076G08]OFK68821.1 hypothetical protein HMPREF2806_05790 [Corynebacterium sp. HMSC076G08]
MTTLADLTPEERAECVGMWCDYRPAVGTTGLHNAPEEVITTVIIKAGNDYDAAYEDEYEVFNAAIGHELVQPEQITLRPDLPRAWAPDGTPPEGEWEYVPEIWNPWLDDWRPIDDATTNEIAAEAWMGMEQFNDEGGRVRKRFIGEWEEA